MSTTRMAVCHCGEKRPSSTSLAFFDTAERRAASRCQHCRYAPIAHHVDVRNRPHMVKAMRDGHDFEQTDPATLTDIFYCGCDGWD